MMMLAQVPASRDRNRQRRKASSGKLPTGDGGASSLSQAKSGANELQSSILFQPHLSPSAPNSNSACYPT
ncbi:hypothetical protein LMH87_003536 [Akanthomyces muscarius]|uniref:Uncharacterized protein n=1 Tax=Akanthomyces muscarius TaxID=2231603 RepID=A0A9W8UG81_AKAMU|nr:hypothetical protein LMH87_003536 [Akanthomyces muscarius]KAJ4144661.1 hypothetical protein LMH87_003536 [Akanthomyces muscarius]